MYNKIDICGKDYLLDELKSVSVVKTRNVRKVAEALLLMGAVTLGAAVFGALPFIWVGAVPLLAVGGPLWLLSIGQDGRGCVRYTLEDGSTVEILKASEYDCKSAIILGTQCRNLRVRYRIWPRLPAPIMPPPGTGVPYS